MLLRSRKLLMEGREVQTGLAWPVLARQERAQRWPEKWWPYICLQWWQERRQEDTGEAWEGGGRRRSRSTASSRSRGLVVREGQWAGEAMSGGWRSERGRWWLLDTVGEMDGI